MAIEIEPERRDGARPARARERTQPPRRPRPERAPRAEAPRARPLLRTRAVLARDGSKPLSAGAVVIVGAIVYVLAGLLNGDSLLRRAETQVEGAPLKGVSEVVARPLATVGRWLALDRPGNAIADARGIDTDDATTFEDLAVGDPGATGPAPLDTAVPAGSADAAAPGGTVPVSEPAPAALPGPTTLPPAPEPTLPPGQPVLRVPTPDDPLRVYAAGDSLVGGWGQALEGLADDDSGLDVELDYEVSTGLVRTDFYNWPGRLKDKIADLDPEVVVLGFGGNDTQPMNIDGRSVPVSDPAWQAEYRSRVGAVMDYVNRDGRKLIWVGTPNHPDPARTAELAIIDTIFREEAAARPNITYVDTWKRFASPDGGYAAYIADAGGEYKPVRADGDGFHLNLDGVNILGTLVLTDIQTASTEHSA